MRIGPRNTRPRFLGEDEDEDEDEDSARSWYLSSGPVVLVAARIPFAAGQALAFLAPQQLSFPFR